MRQGIEGLEVHEELTGHFAGLDLGGKVDFTALAILEQVKLSQCYLEAKTGGGLAHYALPKEVSLGYAYTIIHAEQFPLGMNSFDVVERLKQRLTHPRVAGNIVTAFDTTGAGSTDVALARSGIRGEGVECVEIVITSGHKAAKKDNLTYTVPKQDLSNITAVFLETNRLRIAGGMAEKDTLLNELDNFGRSISEATGYESTGARAGRHDDLVLAVALALWFAEKHTWEFLRIVYDPVAARRGRW